MSPARPPHGPRRRAGGGPAPVSAALLGPARLRRDEPGAGPLGAGTRAAGARQSGGRGGLVDVARLDVSVTSGLRREQPHDAAVAEVGERVDERVDEIAVALAPPDEH